MLLQQLKLHNIRSYLEETIIFPPGATLLSGDIGSGKSTILLAIEFALFGLSRTDLPGEALLRKGSTLGQVQLSFQIEDKNYIVERKLKKEKESVKQTSGALMVEGLRRELTPVELKTEILHILGYPEELASKNKNYLFRYTLYTPQEEMKLILQEEAEIRLDVLRKIFNIDKYKNVRDNLQYFLRLLRANLAVLESKLEPWEELQKQRQQIIEEKEKLAQQLGQLLPQVEKEQAKRGKLEEELQQLEEEQKKFQELKRQFLTFSSLIQEKKKQLSLLEQKEEQLKLLTQKIPPQIIQKAEEEIEEIWRQEIGLREREKNTLLSHKSMLGERRRQLQKGIKETEEQLQQLALRETLWAEKEAAFPRLQEELQHKNIFLEKRKELQLLLEKTLGIISRNETILTQSQAWQRGFSSIENCPTCRQNVPPEHKESVLKAEEEKIQQAQKLLEEFQKKKKEIILQREKNEEEFNQLLLKEKTLLRQELEVLQIKEKRKEGEEKKLKLRSWQEEEKALEENLFALEAEKKWELLEQEKNVFLQQLEQLNNYRHLHQRQEELGKEKTEILFYLKGKQEEEQEISSKISLQKDLSPHILEKKQLLSVQRQQEKELLMKKIELQTTLLNLGKHEKLVQENWEKLQSIKTMLLRKKELHYWLEEYFLPLTITLEKEVMIQIHQLFNQLFQEWFSILISEENIYSRLDDTFTPIIEQNGYEISFINLSGGEKTSAALAYRLALNRVINETMQQIKTKDLLILDEPTDGFSSEQLDKVREVLDRLNLRQTILVSHESKIESFVENVLRINKEGNVSQIVS